MDDKASSIKKSSSSKKPAVAPPPNGKKRPMGRPSVYSEALADRIIDLYASGEPLKTICTRDGMPNVVTVFRWEADKPEFRNRILQARERRADVLFDEALSIADDAEDDVIETKFGPKCNVEFVQRSRLRVETRLRAAALLNRERYGDKQKFEISGSVAHEFAAMGVAELVAEVGRRMPSVAKLTAAMAAVDAEIAATSKSTTASPAPAREDHTED